MAIAGKFLIGVGTNKDANNESKTFTVRQTGGEYNHKLTVGEMPEHRHDSRTTNGWGSMDWGYNFTYTNTAAWNGEGTINIGGNQSHNNTPPYFAVYIWERTG